MEHSIINNKVMASFLWSISQIQGTIPSIVVFVWKIGVFGQKSTKKNVWSVNNVSIL